MKGQRQKKRQEAPTKNNKANPGKNAARQEQACNWKKEKKKKREKGQMNP